MKVKAYKSQNLVLTNPVIERALRAAGFDCLERESDIIHYSKGRNFVEITETQVVFKERETADFSAETTNMQIYKAEQEFEINAFARLLK